MEKFGDKNSKDDEDEVKSGFCDFLKLIGTSIFKIFLIVLSLVDFWSDLLLGISYAKQGENVYALFTFLFTLVPTACGAFYTIRYIRRKADRTLIDKAVFVCCLFLQTHFVMPLWFIEDICNRKNMKKDDDHDQKKKERVENVLTMFDAVEALPQLSFQFTILLGKQGYCTYLQFFTVLSSLFTGSWKLTKLLDMNKTVLKIFMFFINFCWLLPGSVTLGILAHNLTVFSYIATPVKFLVTILMNLVYVRKSNAANKKWSDWLKSIVFGLFVPFYMFSRVGAYLVTIILFLQIAVTPIIDDFFNGEKLFVARRNTSEFCTKCKQNATLTGFFDILFDPKQRLDLATMYQTGSTTVMYILVLFAMVSSFFILSKCCCCCRHKPCLDIQRGGTNVDDIERSD